MLLRKTGSVNVMCPSSSRIQYRIQSRTNKSLENKSFLSFHSSPCEVFKKVKKAIPAGTELLLWHRLLSNPDTKEPECQQTKFHNINIATLPEESLIRAI